MSVFDRKNVTISILVSIILYQFYSQPKDYLNQSLIKQFSNEIHSTIKIESDAVNAVNDKLSQHSKLFSQKEIIKVNDQVYVGIGYGLANSIIIEGDTSYIIVDTLESVDGARQFRNDFNKLYNNSDSKRISAIIFTHYHADHTQGTTAFIDDPNNPPMIISHKLTHKEMHRVTTIQSSIVFIRSMRQFGTYIKDYDNKKNSTAEWSDGHKLHINSGIGPELKYGDDWESSFSLPTRVLDSQFTRMEIDGVILDIYYAPGETSDQIFIYLPQSKTLLPADNIYQTFPNLYAIRGSPTRDAIKWIQSLDMMRYLHLNDINYNKKNNSTRTSASDSQYIQYMVPCHTRPVKGSNAIMELLTVYRDGIQYIHDQTLRFTNKGFTPNEMIPIIKRNMPDRLIKHPWLQEFYGTIDWSIRGIFNSYLGWFSGDAADLFPLSKSKIAQNMIVMLQMFENIKNSKKNTINSIDFMLDIAEKRIHNSTRTVAPTRDDCQWSLDIATNILHLRDDVLRGSELKTSKIAHDKNRNNSKVLNLGSSDGIFVKLSDSEYQRSKKIRIAALTCMAGYQTSANGRNYYLTSALEDSGNFRIKPTKKMIDTTIDSLKLDFLFDALPVRFKFDKNNIDNRYINQTTCFIFDITDDKLEKPNSYDASNKTQNIDDTVLYSWFKLEFRDGIVEIIKGGDLETLETSKFGWLLSKDSCVEDASLVVEMKSSMYRLLASHRGGTAAMLYAAGEIKIVKGSVLTLKGFQTLFEKDTE